MAEKKDKEQKFYQKRSFWAAVASLIAGVLAGEGGVVEAVGSVVQLIIGG